MGSLYGVLQVLGLDLSLGWASVITVFALIKIRQDDRPPLRALPDDGPLARLFAREELGARWSEK